jgi:predicted Zn finger-like uncharacterized protein
MRWNCPHCGTHLAVGDEKLGAGWSFSRCYRCGGFALVRRSDVNLIKVDKAPAGEQVLVPDAEPEAKSEKPVIRPAARRNAPATAASTKSAAPVAASAKAPAAPAGATAAGPARVATPPSRAPSPNVRSAGAEVTAPRAAAGERTFARSVAQTSIDLPEPLPDTPRQPWHYRLLPVAVGVAGATVVASGIYFYLQGQALWDHARTSMRTEHLQPEPRDDKHAAADASAPAPNADAPIAAVPPTAPQTAATNAPGVIAAPALAAQAGGEQTDQVRAQAMAPARDAAGAVAEWKQSQNEAPPQLTHPPAARSIATETLFVATRVRSARLHGGPGLDYPIIATVGASERFAVVDWSDRWFMVSFRGKTAWIRDDLVRRVSADPTAAEAP